MSLSLRKAIETLANKQEIQNAKKLTSALFDDLHLYAKMVQEARVNEVHPVGTILMVALPHFGNVVLSILEEDSNNASNYKKSNNQRKKAKKTKKEYFFHEGNLFVDENKKEA